MGAAGAHDRIPGEAGGIPFRRIYEPSDGYSFLKLPKFNTPTLTVPIVNGPGI
jgi:hypothetical protein